MTTSAKRRLLELRSLSPQLDGGLDAIDRLTRSLVRLVRRRVHEVAADVAERISREAASSTSTATKSAASESALPYPPATRARLISTATDPARSPAEVERVRLERRAPAAARGPPRDKGAARVHGDHDPDHQERTRPHRPPRSSEPVRWAIAL